MDEEFSDSREPWSLKRKWILVVILMIQLLRETHGYGWTALDWDWPRSTVRLVNDTVNSVTAQVIRCCDYIEEWQQPTGNWKPTSSSNVVTYVNGIYHSEEDWQRLTQQLSETFGRQVRPFYNPSSGSWVADATRVGYSLVVRPDDDKVAQGLALHLRNAVKDAGETGRVLHLAHSGGALITYLAAKHHLTSDETDCIDVATFGAARSITRKYFRNRAVNYYARNDPLIRVDRRAVELLKWADPEEGDVMEVNYLKHNTTFIFMEGKARAGLRDHSLEGPTYRTALEMEASEFMGRTATCGVERSRSALILSQVRQTVRLMRKKTARVTGLRHFFSFPLIAIRKLTARTTGMRWIFSGIVTPPIPAIPEPQPYYMNWWEKEMRETCGSSSGSQPNDMVYIGTSTDDDDDDDEASEGGREILEHHFEQHQCFPSQKNGNSSGDEAGIQNKTADANNNKLVPPDFLGKGESASWWGGKRTTPPPLLDSCEPVVGSKDDVNIVEDSKEMHCKNGIDYSVDDKNLAGS